MQLRQPAQLIISGILACMLAVAGCTSPPYPQEDATVEVDSDAPDGGDTPETTYPRVTIATFNLHRFFDTECDTGACMQPQDYEVQLSQDEFDGRAEQIAEAIRSLDADVVALQEIEKQVNLDALTAELGDDYPVAVLAERDSRASLDVAVLARGTLVDTRGYRDRDLTRPDGSKTTFARDFLRVDLDIAGERVIVFAAHFISQRSDDSGRRMAEANGARGIIAEVAEANDDALIVLGGDLNSTPGSEALDALFEDGGLVRAGADESLDETFTYLYQWEKLAIDHLIMAETSGGRYIDGSAYSVHDREPVGLGGSDHGALVAEYEMR